MSLYIAFTLLISLDNTIFITYFLSQLHIFDLNPELSKKMKEIWTSLGLEMHSFDKL